MKELNKENFDEFSRKNRVAVIDFWAPWCAPCLTMKPVLEELEREVNNVAFGKINVDENVELAQKFRIMSIPTFSILVNSEERDRIIGVVQKEEVKERIERYKGTFSP